MVGSFFESCGLWYVRFTNSEWRWEMGDGGGMDLLMMGYSWDWGWRVEVFF